MGTYLAILQIPLKVFFTDILVTVIKFIHIYKQFLQFSYQDLKFLSFSPFINIKRHVYL